jgi:hypothetical protein
MCLLAARWTQKTAGCSSPLYNLSKGRLENMASLADFHKSLHDELTVDPIPQLM